RAGGRAADRAGLLLDTQLRERLGIGMPRRLQALLLLEVTERSLSLRAHSAVDIAGIVPLVLERLLHHLHVLEVPGTLGAGLRAAALHRAGLGVGARRVRLLVASRRAHRRAGRAGTRARAGARRCAALGVCTALDVRGGARR